MGDFFFLLIMLFEFEFEFFECAFFGLLFREKEKRKKKMKILTDLPERECGWQVVYKRQKDKS